MFIISIGKKYGSIKSACDIASNRNHKYFCIAIVADLSKNHLFSAFFQDDSSY